MNSIKFELWLEERFKTLDKRDASFANEYKWKMFLPENYAVIRDHMNANGITPDVVDIGCGAGFGSEFFLDGKYIGIDSEPPHIGIKKYAKSLGDTFFNQEKDNVTYTIDTFPNSNIAKMLRKKTVISSMCLGVHGELFSGNWRNIFNDYCRCLERAKHIYICAPMKLTKYINDYFGGSENIGMHVEKYPEWEAHCPIIHTEL